MMTRRTKLLVASVSTLAFAITFALPASARLASNRLASNRLASNVVSDKAQFDTQVVIVKRVTLPDGTVLIAR